jgi:hypothetical protein
MKNIPSAKKLYSTFRELGYFKIDNFFENKVIDEIKNDLNNIITDRPKEIIFYHDRNNLLRRIEKFFNYTKILYKVNSDLLDFLENFFEKKYNLFKDKCNFKPPQGEGFYPHYDGIFNWVDHEEKKRNGWHDYAEEFINVLIVLDDFKEENGPLEISSVHKGDFKSLLENTKKNGPPDLNKISAEKCKFKKMICSSGSVIVFSSKCPHQSKKNRSNDERGSLYFTYNPKAHGNHYQNYYEEKTKSRNQQSKSLSGEIK